MTEQEAIDYYNNVVIDIGIGIENICKTSDLINLSIKALEKQIPIKPIGKNNVCPKCGVIEFGFNEPNYCEWCGQKLDWE